MAYEVTDSVEQKCQ